MARSGRNNTRLDLILLAACALLALLARALPASLTTPMASGIRRTVLAPLVMLQERAELSRRALILSKPQAAQRDSVTLRAFTVTSLESENDRLRQLMGLGARLKWGFVPAEALHGRNVRDETTLTLTAGSLAGVARMSPVVAPEGLVGIVENVDPTMSQALFWTHPDFRVSAMTADAGAFGIVQSHLASAASGHLLELRGVPFRTELKPNTLIISSGLGGVWPRGIPIGHVIREIKTAEGWARTYLIRPAVFPADVTSVMILKPERVSKGFDNVWASAAGAEAAASRILVAGDSIARSAALAEAAARRAALGIDVDSALAQPPVAGGAQPPRPRPRPPTEPRDTAGAQPIETPPPPTDSVRRDSIVRRGIDGGVR